MHGHTPYEPGSNDVLEEGILVNFYRLVVVRQRARVACIGREREANFDTESISL